MWQSPLRVAGFVSREAGVGVVGCPLKKPWFDLLPTREAADAFTAEVQADEPELAALLRVEEIELV
jgi:hypothetical protein